MPSTAKCTIDIDTSLNNPKMLKHLF
jgi:hypothetical protein